MTSIACPHCGKRVGIPEGGRVGQRFRCPHCAKPISLAQRPRQEEPRTAIPPDWLSLDSPEAAESAVSVAGRPEPAAFEAATSEALPALGAGGATHGLVGPSTATKRRRSKSNRWLIPGGIFAGVVVVVAVSVWAHYANLAARHADRRGAVNNPGRPRDGTSAALSPHEMSTPVVSARPIRLLLAPAGVRIAIAVRPAELWAKSPRAEELRRCLAPIAAWAENQFAELACSDQPRLTRLFFPSFCALPVSRPTWRRRSG